MHLIGLGWRILYEFQGKESIHAAVELGEEMTPVRRERKNQQLEAKLLEYRQWARTYGGYYSGSTVPKQIRNHT